MTRKQTARLNTTSLCRSSADSVIRRIVCISDTHGTHRRLSVPDGDVLIHAGDFMTLGRSVEEIIDFNRWRGEQSHRFKIVIAGNHDFLFVLSPAKARTHLTNASYLENSGVHLGGFYFWGSPMVPVTSDWAFHVERGAASRKYWDKIPVDTDVLITHGPPLGTLDKPHLLASRLGCQELTRAILRVKPKLHVFGHIHGGYGVERALNHTCLVNCAVLNEDYVLTNKPVVIDLAENFDTE